MKRLSALATAAAAMLFAAGLLAQGKNFNGGWTPDTDKNQAAMGNRAGGRGPTAVDLTVVQDEKTLKVTQTTQNGDVTRTYNLDGTETTVAAFRGGDAKATAKWDGDKLVITTVGQGQNGPQTQVVTWYLEDKELVLERSVTPPGGGEAMKIKTYYKKK